MMRLPTCLVLLLHPLSAWGSYGQTSRCLTVQDDASRILIPEFLKNASSCSRWAEKRSVMHCAEAMMPPDTMTLLLPIVKTVKIWEATFRMDLNTAFLTVGRVTGAAKCGHGLNADANAWAMLWRHWQTEGQLCYYDSSPQYADHLEPRVAGLLTLFFSEPRGMRQPVLEPGVRWTYTGSPVCSAGTGAAAALERISQFRAVSGMAIKADTRFSLTPREDMIAMMRHYRDTFSTDPFLQAVITGLKTGLFYCPRDLYCYGAAHSGKVFLPIDNKSFLDELARRMSQGNKVCVIFRDERLQPDVFYVTAGVSAHWEKDAGLV